MPDAMTTAAAKPQPPGALSQFVQGVVDPIMANAIGEVKHPLPQAVDAAAKPMRPILDAVTMILYVALVIAVPAAPEIFSLTIPEISSVTITCLRHRSGACEPRATWDVHA